MNSKNLEHGQSLIELIIAIALFATVLLGLSLFIFDSYNASRLALDMTKADFLAEEGLEAAKSIRDNKFSDLSTGSHGLVISNGHWIFQDSEENLSSQLNGGKRVIEIEDDTLDQNIKKITSIITWKFTENRSEEVKLITYLTNWRAYCGESCTSCDSFGDPQSCQIQGGCRWQGNRCRGNCTACNTFLNQNSCQAQAGCQWTQ